MKKKAIGFILVMAISAVVIFVVLSLIQNNQHVPEAPTPEVVTAEPETPTPEIITPEPETPTSEVITPEPETPTPEIITSEPETPAPEIIISELEMAAPDTSTPFPEIPIPEIATPEPDLPTEEPTAEPVELSTMLNRYAVTNASVKFRAGPGSTYKSIRTLKTGQYVYMIRQELNDLRVPWTYVMVDGDRGYIKSEFLNPIRLAESDAYDRAQSTRAPVFTETDIRSTRAGDIIRFGKYEQDGNPDNGPEDIEWVVLAVQDQSAFIISKYGLEAKPYNTILTDITWETCSLRNWLNVDFLQTAFSSEEQAAILITNVVNNPEQGNSGWKTASGNDTQDRIFILSYAEAKRFYNITGSVTNADAQMEPTRHAIVSGAWFSNSSGKTQATWWLRSTGKTQHSAAAVSGRGALTDYHAAYTGCCVRPALWVDLTVDVFKYEEKTDTNNVE